MTIDELRVKITQTNHSSQAAEICNEMKNSLSCREWTYLFQHSESLSSLMYDFSERIGPQSPEDVLSALEVLALRYSMEINQDEVTIIHICLASHCRRYHLFSKALRPFSQPSSELPPGGLEAQYFADCAEICGLYNNNNAEAAVFAAVALTISPSEQNYRVWCLFELGAHGSVVPLPRIAWSVSCELIDNFSKLFSTKSWSNWHQIIGYFRQHRDAFNELQVGTLVRRALAAYCVSFTREIMTTLTMISTNIILDEFNKVLTFDELVNAGILAACEVKDDTICPVPYGMTQSPMKILTETTLYMQKLQSFNEKRRSSFSLTGY